MMTAAQIAKAFDEKKVDINYLFSEYLTDDFFDNNPIPKLEFKTKELTTLDLQYSLSGVHFTDTSTNYDRLNTTWPETLA